MIMITKTRNMDENKKYDDEKKKNAKNANNIDHMK